MSEITDLASSQLKRLDNSFRRDCKLLLVPYRYPGVVSERLFCWEHQRVTDFVRDADAYDERLEKMPFAELEVEYHLARTEALSVLDATRFFNQPDTFADYDHWSRLPHWTIDEATALSLDRDPREVTWKTVEDLVEQSDFAKRYQRRRELLMRCLSQREGNIGISPSEFVAWAIETNVDLPHQLVESVQLRIPVHDFKTLYETERAKVEALTRDLEALRSGEQFAITEARKEITKSVYRMLFSMAADKYGYDPAERNGTPIASIQKSCLREEFDISDDTIRANLKKASMVVYKSS